MVVLRAIKSFTMFAALLFRRALIFAFVFVADDVSRVMSASTEGLLRGTIFVFLYISFVVIVF